MQEVAKCFAFFDMEYFKNYMADAVVRVDGSQRFVKRLDYENGQKEYECSNPQSVTAFGGESFGVFYILEPISQKDYNEFSRSWTFGLGGVKKQL